MKKAGEKKQMEPTKRAEANTHSKAIGQVAQHCLTVWWDTLVENCSGYSRATLLSWNTLVGYRLHAMLV